MFKRLLNKITKKRDIRFLDAESYKYQQAINSLRVPQSFDVSIQVEKTKTSTPFNNFENLDSSSFLELIRQATAYNDVVEEQQGIQIPSGLSSSTREGKRHLNSLGVFSDSKIYSALIHSVLSMFDLDIQHFNHPVTFKQDNYLCFDSVSAWIIFLSEEQDSDFLDLFLDRYVDKPTLFLFSKLNKDACMSRIEQFIEQNNLEALEDNQKLFVLAALTREKD